MDITRNIEERIAGTTIDQFLRNPAYVDALVLRYNASMGNQTYALQDANWNVVATTDERDLGVIESRYAYEPFGRVECLQSDYTPAGENGWVYLFQGGRLDATVGLTQFRYRDLMMALGRWLSQDPIGFQAGDNNLYRYVGNNPGNRLDAWGLRLKPCKGLDCGSKSEAIENGKKYLSALMLNSIPMIYNRTEMIETALELKFHVDGEILIPERIKPIPYISIRGITFKVNSQIPKAPSTNVQAGTHKFVKLEKGNKSYHGTGGAETCIGVLIVTPCGCLGIFHFYTNDLVAAISNYDWPKGTTAVVFGGDETTLSKQQWKDVNAELALNQIKTYINGSASGVYVDGDLKYSMDYDASKKYAPQRLE